MNTKRLIRSILLAWLIFVGIDFLFHASLLESLWAEDIKAVKPSIDLTLLIPIGYISFLLLTVLVTYVFVKINSKKPNIQNTLRFAFVFGGLYAVSNLLGLISFVDIPVRHLVFFNVVYFIEIAAVVIIVQKTYYDVKNRKHVLFLISLFLALVIIGVIMQNVL